MQRKQAARVGSVRQREMESEEEARARAEAEIAAMEEEERRLIERLRETQHMQSSAYQELESAIGTE